MRKLFIVIGILSISFYGICSQTGGKDSLFEGRTCRLVLYNGYETEGIVEKRGEDTVLFRTDIITLKVPVKDIKFVLNPGFGLPETQDEYDSLSREIIPEVKIDTSDECDLYLDDRIVLYDVELLYLSDSTFEAFGGGMKKILLVSAVRKVVFKPVAPFGKGFLIGAGTGFLAGFLPFAFIEPHGETWGGPGVGLIFGLILAIPGGLIGGVVGVLTSSEDTYLFEKGFTAAKSKRLKYIIEKHRK